MVEDKVGYRLKVIDKYNLEVLFKSKRHAKEDLKCKYQLK